MPGGLQAIEAIEVRAVPGRETVPGGRCRAGKPGKRVAFLYPLPKYFCIPLSRFPGPAPNAHAAPNAHERTMGS